MEADLQKKYTTNLIAALVVCLFFIGHAAISIFFRIYHYSLINLWTTLAIVFTFSVTGLAFQASNKNHNLRLPFFMPEKLILCLQIITGVVFLLSMLYPVALSQPQIWQMGDVFRDRAGHEYTYAQFLESQKQQLLEITFFSIFALLFTITIPFYDRQAKKWVFS